MGWCVIKVFLPSILSKLCGGNTELLVPFSVDEPTSISTLITRLDRDHPGVASRLLDDSGRLRRFVNIYHDGEDIRFLDDLRTPVFNNSEVSIVPAVAGG